MHMARRKLIVVFAFKRKVRVRLWENIIHCAGRSFCMKRGTIFPNILLKGHILLNLMKSGAWILNLAKLGPAVYSGQML